MSNLKLRNLKTIYSSHWPRTDRTLRSSRRKRRSVSRCSHWPSWFHPAGSWLTWRATKRRRPEKEVVCCDAFPSNPYRDHWNRRPPLLQEAVYLLSRPPVSNTPKSTCTNRPPHGRSRLRYTFKNKNGL